MATNFNTSGFLSYSGPSRASADDPRITYSAGCTWWGRIQDTKCYNNIPGCPHCGSPLYEMPSIDHWNASVHQYATENNDPLYPDFITWLKQQRCQPLSQGGASIMRRMFDRSTEL